VQVFRDVQFCRDESGGYWTGWVWPEGKYWPAEHSTWTSAAVILAADALAASTPAHGVFRGTGLPRLLEIADCDEYCYSRVSSSHAP
jgi:hypothetical protein